MNTVIVTGASGLIGSRIVSRLAAKHRVFGLDIAEPESNELEFIKTDLTEDESVKQALETIRDTAGPDIASVVHLAAYYDFSGEPSPLYDTLTVEGTRRLVRLLRTENLNVEQFIFSSSLLVMEPGDKDRQISELSRTRAEWAYPQSKLKAEQAIREECGSMPTVVLRIAGVYDEQCHSLPISQQIARISEKQMESFVFPGDSSHGQALVHLTDLVDGFENTVEHRGTLEDESLFLIAEPDVMSYAELQDQIGELVHGKEWPTIRIPKAVAKAGAWVQDKMASEDEDKPFIQPWMIDLADDHYHVMINHARAKLDWDPQHRLRTTLPAMIEFLKQNPRKFYEENGLPVPDNVES